MQEKTLTGGRSYYLDIARAIAIISISLNHAVNRIYDNYFGQMEEFLESSYLSSLLKSVATVFSHLGVRAFLRSAAVKVTALSPGKAKETTWHCPPFVVKYHGI
jgi:hypothetical protein